MVLVPFKYDNGLPFQLPRVDVQGYHYVRIEKVNIIKQLPSVLKSFAVQKPPKFITFHWTAAPYNRPYNHYQVNIGDDYILVALYGMQYEYYSHTWKRNSENWGCSYMAMAGQVRGGFYDQDIRKKPSMVETGSLTLAALKHYFGLGWNQVTDHDAWSKKDGYDSYRWDNQLVMKSGKTLFVENLTQAKFFYQEYYTNNPKTSQDSPTFKSSDKDKHLAVVSSGTVCEHNTIFKDVCADKWYADEVQKVYDLDILRGYEDSKKVLTFKPEKGITRAEAASVIMKLNSTLGRKDSDLPVKDYQLPFKDVSKSDWFWGPVARATHFGIMVGLKDDKGSQIFNPQETLTRAQWASIVKNYLLAFLSEPLTDVQSLEISFNDVLPSDWFSEAVRFVASKRILVGMKDKDRGSVFDPNLPIKRLEVAVSVAKLYDMLFSKKSQG